MRNSKFLIITPIILGAAIVAVVHAQESSRRSILITRDKTPAVVSPPTSSDSQTTGETPYLSSTRSSRRQPLRTATALPAPQTTQQSTQTLETHTLETQTSTTPGLISERLQAIRQSVSDDDFRSRSSSVIAPPTLSGTPAQSQPIDTHDSASLPASNPAETGLRAAAPAAEMATSEAPRQFDGLRFQTNQQIASNLVVSKGPVLRVEAAGPKSIVIGKSAQYKVSLLNDGGQTAHNAVVRVSLPASVDVQQTKATVGIVSHESASSAVREILWKIETIGAGGREDMTLNLTPTSTEDMNLAIDWTFTPLAATAHIAVKEPKLQMRVNGPTDLQFGDSKVYTITLANPGDGPTENVKVQLEVGGQKAEVMHIGTLNPGQVRDVEVSMEATQAGPLSVDVVASADGGLRAEANHRVMVRHAELNVTVQGPRRKFAGSIGSYKIVVANTGDATATDVVAAAILPRGATPLNNEPLSWKLGSLAAGTEREIIVRCELTTAGNNQFEARVQGAGTLADSMTLATVVESVADLKLTVQDPKGPLPIGQPVTYDITISNRGSKAANNIKLVAQFSKGIEPIGVEGLKGEIVTGQVVFHPVARLNAGESINVQVRAKAHLEGNHIFRAAVQCTEPETRLISEETTHFFADDFGADSVNTIGSQPTSSSVR